MLFLFYFCTLSVIMVYCGRKEIAEAGKIMYVLILTLMVLFSLHLVMQPLLSQIETIGLLGSILFLVRKR